MTLAILLVALFSLFVGVQPAAAASPLAYVTDFFSAAVLVIDTSTNAVVATVPVGNLPSGVAITPDGAFAYVANQGRTVSVIETATNTVVATVPLGPSPFDVAITPDGAFAYVTAQSQTQNTVAVISTATNAVVTTIDLGPGSARRLAITPDGAFAYVTVDFQDTVAVISTATNAVVATVPIDSPGGGPSSLAITPDGAFVYVGINGGPGGVAVIATETNSVAATINVGSVGAVAITPDGAEAYVGKEGSVVVIATATNTEVARVPAEINVRGIAITHPDGAFAYVAQSDGMRGTVAVISTATHTVVDVINAGPLPGAVAITPSEPRVFVTSPAAGATVNGTVWTDVWVENFVGTSNAFTLSVGGTVVAQSTATNHATLAWDSRSIPAGAITLTATVRDAAGRVGAATRGLIVLDAFDVFITSPPAGAVVGGVVWSDIWVEGAAAGPRTFTLSTGSTTLATASASGNHVTLPWDSSRVANGCPATIVATVRDAAGHVGTATRGLIVLNDTALGVFITNPPAGATVGGVVWSDVWVEGPAAGGRTFTLSIGGTTLATARDGRSHVTLPWDSSRVVNGAQAIVVTVRDDAGHVGVGTRSVNIQNGLLAGAGTAPRSAIAPTR
jgi:YVTN family beta-propeller protein